MKVIELLNKIANGEEVPKRIKTKNDIWIYDGIDYRASDDRGYMFEVYTGINKDDLNEEVEIIEEDNKIEKIPYQFNLNYIDSKLDTYTKEEFNKTMNYIYDKINEIIDKVNNE